MVGQDNNMVDMEKVKDVVEAYLGEHAYKAYDENGGENYYQQLISPLNIRMKNGKYQFYRATPKLKKIGGDVSGGEWFNHELVDYSEVQAAWKLNEAEKKEFEPELYKQLNARFQLREVIRKRILAYEARTYHGKGVRECEKVDLDLEDDLILDRTMKELYSEGKISEYAYKQVPNGTLRDLPLEHYTVMERALRLRFENNLGQITYRQPDGTKLSEGILPLYSYTDRDHNRNQCVIQERHLKTATSGYKNWFDNDDVQQIQKWINEAGFSDQKVEELMAWSTPLTFKEKNDAANQELAELVELRDSYLANVNKIRSQYEFTKKYSWQKDDVHFNRSMLPQEARGRYDREYARYTFYKQREEEAREELEGIFKRYLNVANLFKDGKIQKNYSDRLNRKGKAVLYENVSDECHNLITKKTFQKLRFAIQNDNMVRFQNIQGLLKDKYGMTDACMGTVSKEEITNSNEKFARFMKQIAANDFGDEMETVIDNVTESLMSLM